MDVDPLASMRCWAITVELAGREYEIPALPAVDWWPIVAAGDPSGLIDLLRSTDGADLDAFLLDGTITSEELGTALTDAIEEATGRTFHAAFVLATVAAQAWSGIGGRMAKAGFRWDVQPIGAALDLVYILAVEGLEKEPQKKFLAILENEGLTRGKPTERQVAKVSAEFETMAGPRPAPAPLPAGASAELSDNPRPRTRTRPRQPRQGGQPAAPRTRP